MGVNRFNGHDGIFSKKIKINYLAVCWKFLTNKTIGIVPLTFFIFCGVLILFEFILIDKGLLLNHKDKYQAGHDIITMFIVVVFFGFACGEIGKRIPIIGKFGAAAICATFIPSALVYYGLLPTSIIEATKTFYKGTNILYLFIACIIVGSIMKMDRKTLIQGFIKIFIPMISSVIVSIPIGILVGKLVGFSPVYTFFFLVLPIMCGGVGEGAIPLSIGYATLLGMAQGDLLGRILPIVMLGNLVAIIMSGILNQIGKRKPHLTGNGELFSQNKDLQLESKKNEEVKATPQTIIQGILLAFLFFMLGNILQGLIGLPAPIGMLFCIVIFKLTNIASPQLLSGSGSVYNFVQKGLTFPILFAVGVAITPWDKIVSAFTISNLIVITSVVCSMVFTGFIVSKLLKMYPIDAAVISCCQCGQGGTGDVAILTASNRLSLMPFAQIATRIGGGINSAISLIILKHLIDHTNLLTLLS